VANLLRFAPTHSLKNQRFNLGARWRSLAQRLIAEGKMPSFEELVAVIAEVREKYRPLILAARKESNETESCR
jgi:hypothetical protein